MSRADTFKLLNKTPISTLVEKTELSKSFISQVKHGKRPPSQKLIQALLEIHDKPSQAELEWRNALDLFIKSRREGISPNTIRDYRITLSKALKVLGLTPSTAKIKTFLNSLHCSMGGKYGYFKDIRAFYNWLYSPRSGLPFQPQNNPVTWVDAPKRPKLILPSLTKQQVESLMESVPSVRDKAIIALLTESGLRLSELANIRKGDIDWDNHTIKTLGKGNKEGYAPFGALTEQYLESWL
ncbi:MAG: tyrosine-type recombinase/integrase, partial [Dehalococcoidia bacterium]